MWKIKHFCSFHIQKKREIWPLEGGFVHFLATSGRQNLTNPLETSSGSRSLSNYTSANPLHLCQGKQVVNGVLQLLEGKVGESKSSFSDELHQDLAMSTRGGKRQSFNLSTDRSL